MQVRSIDVYVAYTCNLRCTHCFLGDHLDSKHRFTPEELRALAETAQTQWGTEEVTLLGGEPTLYPRIIDVVGHIQSLGMRARLVTNGQHAFGRFLRNFRGGTPPTTYFSIDGSCPAVHDAIRGPGTFDTLVENIRKARELGYRSFGIMSVTRTNAHDVLDTLELCGALGLEHVNVHDVTNRGYATEASVLPLAEWQDLRRRIETATLRSKVAARVDHSLARLNQYKGYCSVRERNNLMFYPDGRVFICAMSFDVPGAHAFVWRDNALTPNRSLQSESSICRTAGKEICPAMKYVNPELVSQASSLGCTIGCIYEKVDVRDGATTIDSEMAHIEAPR